MKYLVCFISVVALLGFAAVGLAESEVMDNSACIDCHEEIAAHMAGTAHGLTQRGAPGCQDCHGNGSKHIEEGDPSLIEIPSGMKGEEACRTCHTESGNMPFATKGSLHAATTNCFTCHKVHGKLQPCSMLCTKCHPAEANSFSKPYGHNLSRSGMTCVSCHNPHAGSGSLLLKKDHSGQGPCVTCHTEKRGPFVFPHVNDVTGDCMSCHQPHGSTNPMSLTRSRVDQLCLECHSLTFNGTLGSQPPSTHDLRSPRYRNCTVCHAAIHGSNTSATLLR